ncbi:hypothetical protein D3C78_763830 [compost metagenome]
MDKYVENPEEDVEVVFSVIESNGKINLIDSKAKTFDADLKLNVNIEEVSKKYMFSESEAIAALKKQLEIEVTEQLQQFLDKIRKINSDCVGFGEVYRSRTSTRHFEKEKWGEKFPHTTLKGR